MKKAPNGHNFLRNSGYISWNGNRYNSFEETLEAVKQAGYNQITILNDYEVNSYKWHYVLGDSDWVQVGSK